MAPFKPMLHWWPDDERSHKLCEALIDLAVITADGIASMRHIPADDRRVVAELACEFYFARLDEIGARMSQDAFIARCGLSLKEIA